MLSMDLPDPEKINEASDFIAPYIRKTPVEESIDLSSRPGSKFFLKLENLQNTGSFKIRGALWALRRLKKNDVERVITSSAGNHGWALAWAGKNFGCKVTVFVPPEADTSKCAGMEALGAEVILNSSPGYDEAEKQARATALKRGLPFISPYDDIPVMIGNGGTLAAELLDQLPQVENIVFPVGGGGLGAGMAAYVKTRNPAIKLIACQHLESPALALSLKAGKALTSLPAIETIAGGIEGGIGLNTFPILQKSLDRVILISEEELRQSIIWLLSHHKYLVEASGAAPLAAALFHPDLLPGGVSALVLTGRNISYSVLASIVSGKTASGNGLVNKDPTR